MPKIFEYFGFYFFFYSNEHEPIHVHVVRGDNQLVYEIIIENGNFVSLARRNVKGYLPLSPSDAKVGNNLSAYMPWRLFRNGLIIS